MKSYPVSAFIAAGLVALLGACSSGLKPDSVVVSVADLKPASLTATETQMTMTLRYTSESLNAFGFSGSSHKLYLNGGYVGKAVSSKALGLPPLSSATQEVPLIMDNGAVIRQLANLNESGLVKYRLESVLFFNNSQDDEVRLKSTFQGTIDLHALQSK